MDLNVIQVGGLKSRIAGRKIMEIRRLGGLEAACGQFQQRTLEGMQAPGDSETSRLLIMIVSRLDKGIS